MNGLGCPPNVPQQRGGTFTLYRDNNWRSEAATYAIADYPSSERQSISGTSMQDQATWVAYNLPVGVVVTLMDNVTQLGNGQLVGDLSGAGRCVDLVGTGRTEGLSLLDCNMNDCISCFFWRNVDLDLGAVVLYEDIDYGGSRSILFLSEWPANQTSSIADWYLQDRLSSIRWDKLNDRQQVWFYNNVDGTGGSYTNTKGWGTFKEIADLRTVGFNDVMSAFKWQGLVPKKEIIEPFTLNLTFAVGDQQSISQTTDYRNAGSVQQSFVASFTDSEAQTLTVSTTETVVTGFEFSYTTSQTKTVQLSFTENVTAVPNAVTHATLVAKLGAVQPTTYTTTAHRWYDQPVTGAVQDPQNNNWWKRDEKISGQISGGLAGSTDVAVSATPLN
jgi:hypothetical protein